MKFSIIIEVFVGNSTIVKINAFIYFHLIYLYLNHLKLKN